MKNRLPLLNQLAFFLVIFIFLFGCKNQNKDENGEEHITVINALDKSNQVQSLLELFELSRIVELKTEPEKVIGKIKRLKVIDNNIFIFDNIRNTVYRFNSDGEFLNFIGQKGGGPKEYQHPIDFWVDSTNKEVHILDNEKKILRFSFDGEFIEKVTIPIFANFIELSGDNKYLLISNASNYGRNMSFFVLNKNGEVIDEQLPFPEKNIKIGFGLMSGFSQLKNEKTLCLPLNDTIYSYYEEDLHPKYFFDFGNEKLADEIYCKHNDEFELIKEMEKLDKVLYLFNYVETVDLCYAIYVKGKNLLNSILYSKATQKVYYYNGKNIGDILNGGFTCSSDNGEMVYVLNTYFSERSGFDLRIRNMDKKYKQNESYQRIKSQCLKSNKMDNPSLLLLKPKKNI